MCAKSKISVEQMIEAGILDPKEYNYELMRRVLETIANCSEGSTVSGVRGLATKTLESLK